MTNWGIISISTGLFLKCQVDLDVSFTFHYFISYLLQERVIQNLFIIIPNVSPTQMTKLMSVNYGNKQFRTAVQNNFPTDRGHKWVELVNNTI